jgi:competence protein ComEC
VNRLQIIHKHEIAFVRILISFILGILSYYGCTNDWALNQLILTNSVLFFYLFFRKNVYKKPGKTGDKSLNGFILHLLFFFSGCLCSTLHNNHNNTDYYLFKKQNYLKIRIIDEPKNKQNIILFTAETSESINTNNYKSNQTERKYNIQSSSGKIKVTILKNTDTTFYLKYGDELIIPAKPTEIKPPLNPSEFNYKSWLASQNIYHQFLIKQEELIKLKSNAGNSLIKFTFQLRERQVRFYRSIIKNDDAFAVAATLILGYRADLSSEILEIYSKTGTIHALSVSGMHVGLVYFILNYLLWFMNRKQNWKIIKTLLILISIWFYTLLTGFSPSVLRASIMISVFIIAKVLSKNTNSYNIIAFSAFCILLYNPFLIWDIGFQLSFIAVLGLIYLQPKIEKWLPVKHLLLSKLWNLIAMSLAAQLATYPFSVYYFHQFPVYFLLSNLFITIPTALIMYIGIIILIFRLNSLGPLFEWLINFTNMGLDQIASLPFSGITSIWLNKIELILLCLSILLLTMALAEFKKQLLIYSVILFTGLQCLITYDKLLALHQKKVIHFKLQKNYAIALVAGQRAVLFTNLKPTSKAFNYAVKPALDQHRIKQITFRSSNITNVLKDNLIFD